MSSQSAGQSPGRHAVGTIGVLDLDRQSSYVVEFRPPDVAVLSLVGSQGAERYEAVKHGLAAVAVRGNVLVDLARCSFLDGELLPLLETTQAALHGKGGRLALVIPAAHADLMPFALRAGVIDRFTVHSSRETALASLDARGDAPSRAARDAPNV
jgi:hypothetical protein